MNSMRKRSKYNFLLILSLMQFFTSCGGGNNNAKSSFVDTLMAKEGPITAEERNIATRICYAYQSKSNNFRSGSFIGTNFLFSGKMTDCKNSVNNYQINSTLKYDDKNNLSYQSPSTLDSNLSFNKSVQTDSVGYLAQICSKIQNNQEISNTIDQQNIKVQISFIREELDGFLLQYFNKQPDGSYKIDSAEKLKTRSMIDFKTGQIMGMDEYYSYQKVCTSSLDKNKYSEFVQGFISR